MNEEELPSHPMIPEPPPIDYSVVVEVRGGIITNILRPSALEPTAVFTDLVNAVKYYAPTVGKYTETNPRKIISAVADELKK